MSDLGALPHDEDEAPSPNQTGGSRKPQITTQVWGLILTFLLFITTWCYLSAKAQIMPAATAEVPAPVAAGSVLALLMSEKLADVGQLMSGIAAAVAFIWIVLAFVQQSHDLHLQREELKLQRIELKLQRRESKRLTHEARQQVLVLNREVFLRMLEINERQFALRVASLLSLYAEARRSEIVLEEAWTLYGQGDRDIFSRRQLLEIKEVGDMQFMEVVIRIADGRDAMNQYCELVDRFLVRADQLAPDLRDMCQKTPWYEVRVAYGRLLASPPHTS